MTVTAQVPAAGRALRRPVKLAAAGLTLAAVGAVAGWQAPAAMSRLNTAEYLGASAETLAGDLNCVGYRKDAKKDESVYRYADRGTCALGDAAVTVTTFRTVAEGEAFATMMNGIIPLLHPTWSGAATAAGDGWNVAESANLSAKVAEDVVIRLGAGAVRVIPTSRPPG
ncbi:hypothetical protein [Pilimelia columellifera]|uniref:Uncharacterized protein n=1 Tax=Pilimelia columellifera subsp. columellifera TaxID=706583 RepID=A0ABP6AVT6_9ACTN